MSFEIYISENFRKQAKRLISKITHINMVSIYDKSEYENVSDTKLQELLNQIFDELKL